jgi:O-antigen/teichoic acid export membrane protein
MDAYAFFSIIQVVLTCAAAYCLSLFESQRLLIYAILMAAISILTRLFYQAYCHIKFKEARYHLLIDRGSMKQIGKFAGVSTSAGILESLYSQGIIIVINWSFGVALNAVYTIASQLKNSVMSFAFNIFKAMSPQITKTYACGDIETHKRLVYSACKIQAYMIYFIMIPFLFRTDYIMHLWLGSVPPYAVSFAQATIFISLLYALFEPIKTAVLATNNIAKFMIIPNIYYITSLVLSYYLAYKSNSPMVFILSLVILDVIGCAFRLYYALQVSPILLKDLFAKVIVPAINVAIGSTTACWFLSIYTNESLLDLIVFLVTNSIVLILFIYLFGINHEERILVNKIVKKYIVKHIE